MPSRALRRREAFKKFGHLLKVALDL